MFRLLIIDFLDVENGSDAEPEGRPRHQVCYDALVSFTFIDLSELFLILNFNTDAVLQHILNVLLGLDRIAICVLRGDYFLEVRWMGPGDLDRGGRLRYMGEDSRRQAVLLD